MAYTSLSGKQNTVMRTLLYDLDPSSHRINISEFAQLGLAWHSPERGKDLPDLKEFAAVVAHVSDEVGFKQEIAQKTIDASIPLVLYSGDHSIATRRESELRTKNPAASICSVRVDDLSQNLRNFFPNGDVSELCWDRLSDVLEILTTLWTLGIVWEAQGEPRVLNNQDGTLCLSGKGSCTVLADADGSLQVSELYRLMTTDGRRLDDLRARIYRSTSKPDMNFAVLRVSSPNEYCETLALLRDSLLAWANIQ
jgi:hypothetical protein